MRLVPSTWALLALISLSWPGLAHAEWQIRPAVSVNLAQDTTFVAPQSSGSIGHLGFGASGVLLGNILGVEGDFGRRTGFFPAAKQAGAGIVLGSSATTFTGNVVVTLPSRLVEYTLRPYFVGGAGVMLVRIDQLSALLDVSENMKAMDIGGGVTGFLTNRIGLNWDVRHFRNLGEIPELSGGRSIGPPKLSYWRANMALAIRY